MGRVHGPPEHPLQSLSTRATNRSHQLVRIFSDFACLYICIWILTFKYLFWSFQWEPRTVITSYHILCISLSLWWTGGGWVSYPTRWSLLFIFGFSNGSSIYISSPSKQQRNIVQLCTRGGWAQLVAGSILVTDEVITFYLNSQVSNYKRFLSLKNEGKIFSAVWRFSWYKDTIRHGGNAATWTA